MKKHFMLTLSALFLATGALLPAQAAFAAGQSQFINGPADIIDHIPTFGNAADFLELEAHEFGHSLIPVAFEKDSPVAKQIKQSEYLHGPVAKVMETHSYNSWETVLEETILRACVVHIIESYDPDQAAELIKTERESGFTYIDSVYGSIKKYLAAKDEYETFAEFLPIIMEDLMRDFPE